MLTIVPVWRSPHARQERPHAVVRAVQVRGEDAVPVIERQRREAALRDVDAGGVHEHVHLAEARAHRGAHRRHGVRRADVARKDADSAIRPGTGQRRRLGERLGPPPDESDAPAFGGEFERHGSANAAARTGHDGGRHRQHPAAVKRQVERTEQMRACA